MNMPEPVQPDAVEWVFEWYVGVATPIVEYIFGPASSPAADPLRPMSDAEHRRWAMDCADYPSGYAESVRYAVDCMLARRREERDA